MNLLTKVAYKAQKVGKVISKHSPELMIAGGVILLVAGAVIACTKSPEAKEVIEEAKANVEEIKATAHDKKDIYRVYVRTGGKLVKLYLLPVVIFALGIGFIVTSHNIQMKRYDQVLAAYYTLDQSFKSYRAKIADTVGEEKEKELFAQSQIEAEGDYGDFSGYSYGRWFSKDFNPNWRSDMDEHGATAWLVNVVQPYFNDKLKSVGHVFLNDVYNFLGFEPTLAGYSVGWALNNPDSDGYISLDLYDKNDQGEHLTDDIFINFNVDGPILNKIGLKRI